MARVLVTGGAGYIGSHTVVALLEKGYEVVVVDNLSNASLLVLERIKSITGKEVLGFHQVDVRDPVALAAVFEQYATTPNPSGEVPSAPFSVVIHFAGSKAVGESVDNPLLYFQNNVGGTICLLQTMQKFNVTKFIFSSSACVYGDEKYPDEETTLKPENPYGRSKMFAEQVIRDSCVSKLYKPLKALSLRYFNPVGAHPTGLIGEDPQANRHLPPNNLTPFISQVAIGKRPVLFVYGSDYPTRDGSGVRDYIHVMDVAEGHVAAINFLDQKGETEAFYDVLNLGTGKGTSVLEMVEQMRKATGKTIPIEIAPRRPGDVAEFFANVTKAQSLLQWSASRSLEQMCHDLWNFQVLNPDGYVA